MADSPEFKGYKKLVATHESFLRRLYDLTYHVPLVRNYEPHRKFGIQRIPEWYRRGDFVPTSNADMFLEQANLFKGRSNDMVLLLGKVERYERLEPTLGLEVSVINPQSFQPSSPEELKGINIVRYEGVHLEVYIDPRYLRPDIHQPKERTFFVDDTNEIPPSHGRGLDGFYYLKEIDSDDFRRRWLQRVEAALLTV